MQLGLGEAMRLRPGECNIYKLCDGKLIDKIISTKKRLLCA